MAEAIAGLSLAANILQMVEYGAVFVTTAWKIHSEQTDTEVVKDFKQLQYLAKDVEKVLGSVGGYIPAQSSKSGGDPELGSLAEECRKVTVEILEFVGRTGDQRSWKTRMHKAVKEAFQLTWGQGKLAKLQTRLDSLRSQLTLRLVHSLRHSAAASTERQEVLLDRILEEMKQYNYKVDQALGTGLGTVSVDLIARKLNERLAGSYSIDITESLRSEILGVISGPRRTLKDTDSTEPSTVEVSRSRKQTLKQKLLGYLSYRDMLSRENSVVTASETTFRWIFEREHQSDRPWASFCQWLEASDKQLYWITGKPGSGKSTLMKFISQPPHDADVNKPGKPDNEPRCFPFLKKWAGSNPLIIASYYFWAIGSPMQRSKEGMLRSLLYGLFTQSEPEAIAATMPESWEALHLFDEDPQFYTEDSMMAILSRAFDYLCPSTKICLFIDGLDEFEGRHENLVLYLRDALKAYPIKLCVSSRQWQVFEDEFHDTPSLRLQDLTLPDMMTYVQSELYTGPAFSQLRERDPSFFDRLNENVALRSNGVFLWLKLVVKSLRKGILAGDRISDLQMRLDQLPQDLEDLFGRILDELDPEYLDHAIQYFKLMEARLEIGMPNVMVLSYADEEDETFGINCPVSPLDWKVYESRRDHLKRRLNSRCMGLLEITEPKKLSPPGEDAFTRASKSHVNYLHKTVGEYIARDEVRQRLNRRAGQGFDGDDDLQLRLCSSELAFFKSSPSVLLAKSQGVRGRPFRDLWSASLNCLRHAAQVQGRGLQSMIRVVEVLESFYPVDFKTYGPDDLAIKGLSSMDLAMLRALGTGPPFIRHCIELGVVEYIRAKAHRQNSVLALKFWRKTSSARRMHIWLSRRDIDMWSEIDWQLLVAVLSPSPNPAIVELLLEIGADPLHVDDGEGLSIWELALMSVIEDAWEGSQTREKRLQIVAFMIKHGAPIERKFIALAAKAADREMDDASYSTIEKQLKAMKQEIRSSKSLTS